MTNPKVFIASSSEALDVANSAHTLLQGKLAGVAEVSPWPEQFQLTKTYIESLEQLLLDSDFAVLVLTPDDLTDSREIKRRSPRDNVIFELGLFFGRLGRERCFLLQRHDRDLKPPGFFGRLGRFLLQRHDRDLKLPSDLDGIEPAKFSFSGTADIESALDSPCSRIATAIHQAMKDLPSIPKLDEVERSTQAAMRRFGERIIGTWWERIQLGNEAPHLAFLFIEFEETYGSVQLHGKAYAPDGSQTANLMSAAARLEKNRIVYVRKCRRLDITSSAWRPGLGEAVFDDPGDVIEQGYGTFWESDESHPEDTVVKRVKLRRNHSDSDKETMQNGSEAQKRALVQTTLSNW